MSAQSSIARSEVNRERVLLFAMHHAETHGGQPPRVKDIADHLKISKQAVSRHVAALIEANEWPDVTRTKVRPKASFYRKCREAQMLLHAAFPERYKG